MVGYGGSFLKGLAGGLQTGINMGTQLQEMRWQKKQRKQLEETQTRMLEAGNLWNAKIKEISADNIITDEEMAQLSTVFLSGGYEFMEHYGSAMNYITGMKDKEYKQELEWINLYIDGIAGLSPGDIQAAYDFIEPKITSEKGLNMLEAYTNMQKRKQEAMQAQPTAEVFTTLEAARAKYPEAKIEFNAQAGGYVVEAGEVKPPAAPPTELDIMGETQKKLDYAYNTGNANYFNQIAKSLGVNTTFDTYKQKPGVAGGAEKPRVTSLSQLEDYRDKALNADSWEDAEKIINDYTQAGYDATQLGVTKEAWANSQKEYLNKIKMALDNITNEKGWLKTGTLTSDEVGLDFKGEQKVEDIYKQLYEQYMKYFNMLTKMGLPLLEFPILKPLEKIEKVGLWEGVKTFGGVGKGQYKSIYK